MKKKLNFALVGCSGFIAKKHVSAIKKLNHNLKIVLDKSDSAGYLDSYFPDCIFFKDQKSFFSNLVKYKIDFVVLCLPNYLHFKFIELSLKKKCNVICEKPTVIKSVDLDKIDRLEKKYKKKCYSILQLRHDKELIKLQKKLKKSKKIFDGKLTYITSRGDWYTKSWKGDEKLSGGIIYNIGIHFFDLLSWFFGDAINGKRIIVSKKTQSGFIQFKNAKIKWMLSTDRNKLPNKKIFAYRNFKIGNQEINLSKSFLDLHVESYKNILNKKGTLIKDIHKTYKNIDIIKN